MSRLTANRQATDKGPEMSIGKRDVRTNAMRHQSRWPLFERNYFLAISLILLLLSIVAFSDNLITDVHQESNRDPKFVVHGLFWLAWFVLFVVQSSLIRHGNRALHRKIGILTLLVGLGVFISTAYVFSAVYSGWSQMPFFAKANRFLMAGFAIFILLAYRSRVAPVRHKRFMLMANLYVLLPIIDRVAGHIGVETFVFTPVVWNLLFASMFFYDHVTLGRIHRITSFGFVLFWMCWVAGLVL